MKILYFYSQNQREIRHASIKSMSQVVSIINQEPNELFLKFLMFKSSALNQYEINRCQNRISRKNIRLLLDATGHFDKYAFTGIELNRILLRNQDEIKNIFALAHKGKFVAKYLVWIYSNYLELFNFYYGKLILIVSDIDDIKFLPNDFNPIAFKPDKKIFYSKLDHSKTLELCKACKIKINKGRILTLYLNTFLTTFVQLALQNVNLKGGFMIF